MVQKGEIPIFDQQSIDIPGADMIRYSCWGGQQTAFFSYVLPSSIPVRTKKKTPKDCTHQLLRFSSRCR